MTPFTIAAAAAPPLQQALGGRACTTIVLAGSAYRQAPSDTVSPSTLVSEPFPSRCTTTEWRERKERYLGHLTKSAPEALLISLADKVYNVRAILADHRQIGEKVWERFVPPKEGTL